MSTRLVSLALGFWFAAVAACTDSGADPDAGECLAPVATLSANYAIDFEGFPGIENGALVDPDGAFERELSCTVASREIGASDLTLTLTCPLDDIAGEGVVTLTTRDPGALIEVEVGASLSLSSRAYLAQGGDSTSPVFRALANATDERHVLRDTDGLLFAAVRGGIDFDGESLEVALEYSCPGWQPCADGDISGTVRLSSGSESIEIEIGEAGTLSNAGQAWTLRLFQARLGDCHRAHTGSFSLVREG